MQYPRHLVEASEVRPHVGDIVVVGHQIDRAAGVGQGHAVERRPAGTHPDGVRVGVVLADLEETEAGQVQVVNLAAPPTVSNARTLC